MKKLKPSLPWYAMIRCPICGIETFEYYSSSGEWGTEEQHGFCHRCGYIVKQAYSPVYDAFWDVRRGFRLPDGRYIPKNVKKHKRIRRKKNVKSIDINPIWINYI